MPALTLLVFALPAVDLPATRAAAQSPEDDGPTPVVVADVDEAPALVSLPLTGTVRARRVSRVAAQVAGYVSRLEVDIGDGVAGGAVLARLDDALQRADVAAAEAALAEARARRDDAVRRRREAVPLVDDGNFPRTQYESLIAEVAQERANVARLEAELERRQDLLARHTIEAPFDGVIATRLTEAGQWLQAGAPVVELHELDVVRVQAEVPQAWYGRVAVGTPAELIFDAYPDRPMRAEVSRRVAIADPAARTFPVLLELDNRSRTLTPGMSVRVGLEVASDRSGETLQVPRDAVVRGPDGVTRVWVVRQAARGVTEARPIPVRLGRDFGASVEIVDGDVRDDDRVIVRGNEALRAGEPVRAVAATTRGS